MKLKIYLVLLVIALVVAYTASNSYAISLSLEVILIIFLFLIDIIISVNQRIILWVKGATCLRKKRIRFSMSYIYRIELDGKYLFVRGVRIPDQFQPVGGVYKWYDEAKEAFDEMGVVLDDSIPIDDVNTGDLRVTVPGHKMISFILWFHKRKGREVSQEREFREELIRSGILDRKKFENIHFRHVKNKETPLHFSDHFNCHEILVAEVYEFKPSETQKKALRKLMKVESNQFVWVDIETIKRKGYKREGVSVRLSETCEWVT